MPKSSPPPSSKNNNNNRLGLSPINKVKKHSSKTLTEHKEHWDDNGKILKKHYFLNRNGNVHGLYKGYWRWGKLYIERNYKNGECKEYDGDGKTLESHYFRDENNKCHGSYKEFQGDGYTLYKHLNYKHGVLHGFYKKYDEDGILYEHKNFFKGELV